MVAVAMKLPPGNSHGAIFALLKPISRRLEAAVTRRAIPITARRLMPIDLRVYGDVWRPDIARRNKAFASWQSAFWRNEIAAPKVLLDEANGPH